MSTKRITISIPIDIAAKLEDAAGKGSVSAWVTNSVARTLEEEDLQRQFLEFCDSIDATAAEEKRAEASFQRIIGRSTKAGRSAKRVKQRGGRAA